MISTDQPELASNRAEISAPGVDELIRSHYRMQRGRFLTEFEESEDGAHCASDVAAPVWNHSIWLGDGDLARLGRFLDAAGQWHNARKRRPVLYVNERDLPLCQESLAHAGFEPFEREVWMIRPVTSNSAADGRIEVEAAQELDEFTRIFRQAFGAASTAYDAALRREPKDGETFQRHLLARLDGEPAAVGSVTIDGELACIYNVGTAHKARGRGAGRAMVERLIACAREEGRRWVFLQVEAGSPAERLYTKLGFEPSFSRIGYRKTEWTPKSERIESALSKTLGFKGRSDGPGAEGRETRGVSAEISQAIQRLCRTEGTSQESLVIGLWAILLERYTSQATVAFRVRFPGEDWQTMHRSIRPDASVISVLKERGAPGDPADPEAETEVCFGAVRSGSVRSICLAVPCAPLTSVEFNYRAELFSKDSVRRMANHFLTLLESVAANPRARVRELEMLTAAEREQLLVQWADGGVIECAARSAHELIEAQAQRAPNSLALELAGTTARNENPRLTYGELIARAGELAASLIASGVGPGSAVGVLLPRSLDYAVSILAIWRAGGVFVPLDSTYPAARLGFIIDDSRIKAVITDESLSRSLPDSLPKIFVERPVRGAPAAAARVEAADAAYIIYTSGSTGQPKGVVISHGALARHVQAMVQYYEITPRDRHLHFSPFTFDASLEQLLPPLAAGATVVIRDERLWEISEFIQNLSAYELTMVDVPMAYWHQIAQHDGPFRAPAGLRLVIAGGEAMSAERLAHWQRGPFADCRLVNAYGPTEATITCAAFEAANFKPNEDAVNSVPIGRPLPGRSIFILNEFLQPAPIRAPGLLYVGGPLLATGYLNRPELTRERFIQNPFGDGLLYCAGDLARYLEDGAIEFLGRADDQVKIRGFRIEPGEIEAALRAHNSVREAVVVAREEAPGQKRLVAYVAARRDQPSERELHGWLRARLPEHMVPSAIVVLDELPMLNSGKVNRKALPDPRALPAVSQGSATPRTPLELQLQILFQRVLRRNGVGVDESFFQLGGDSLQALELIVQIERTTGKHVPLEFLFERPNVQALAAELERATQPDEWSSLVSLQRGGSRPPLFLVHTTPGDVLGYGNLIHHLDAGLPCYGFQALGLKNGADPHGSIEEMAAHYVKLLRAFQPHGPYYLGGWCFGGIVAVEIAQQLQRLGENVAALLLMETISVSPGFRHFRYHAERFRCLFGMSPARWREYLKAKARYRRQVEMDNRMRFRQAGGNIAPDQRRWLERLERVYNANLTALDAYRSRYYRGKVTLFNAIERDPGILPDRNYGWTGLADEIEIHEVAGDHDTMLAEPNVSSLAEAIHKALSVH